MSFKIRLGQCISLLSRENNVLKLSKSSSNTNYTLFRLNLECLPHQKCNIKTTKLLPNFWLYVFLLSCVSFGVPLCHCEKKQLVTPYGREWRGHFQHLPAWTPPYVVEFGCLLSLINEKSDLLFFDFSPGFSLVGNRGTRSRLHPWFCLLPTSQM